MKHARADYNRFQDPENKIPQDEPVFLIRGQDLVAPKVLRFYAAHAAGVGADNKLVLAVLNHATAMEHWQREVTSKTPDMP